MKLFVKAQQFLKQRNSNCKYCSKFFSLSFPLGVFLATYVKSGNLTISFTIPAAALVVP